MNIELKKIVHSKLLTRGTNAFTANLYIEGVHAGYVKNDGGGGNTDYEAKDKKGHELIVKAEKYFQDQPKTIDKNEDTGENYVWEQTLDRKIDDLFDAWELNKYNKLVEKQMERGIVWGIPGDDITIMAYKGPFKDVLAHPRIADILKRDLAAIIPRLKNGVILQNTNIPEHLLKHAGLQPEQYAKPIVPDHPEIKNEQSSNQKR